MLMRINVAQLLKQQVGEVRYCKIDDIGIRGEARLLRTNRGVLVTAELETGVTSVCSRCLEEFEYPLTLSFEEEYFPLSDVNSGIPLPQEAEGFIIDEEHTLDLSEAIRQYVLLALPMKPICRKDCAGLCPVCGKNLNYGQCNCSWERPYSPWVSLQSLFSGKRG
jgi:uncharacterized protein